MPKGFQNIIIKLRTQTATAATTTTTYIQVMDNMLLMIIGTR
jgi:hypothetical protein